MSFTLVELDCASHCAAAPKETEELLFAFEAQHMYVCTGAGQ